MKHPGMGCIFWTLVFDMALCALAISGMQDVLEIVKGILG